MALGQQHKLMDCKRVKVYTQVQSRVELDDNLVDEYANLIADGTKLPPPIVYFDAGTGEYILAAGFHRQAAHLVAGTAATTYEIRLGTIRDATLFSAGENAEHGKRRTNADKRNAVMMLLNDEQWRLWTDREIAHKTGTSHPFVSQLRHPEKAAAKKTERGQIATPKTPPATSKPGVVLRDSPEPTGNVTTPKVNSTVTTPAEWNAQDDDSNEDPVAILSAEVDRLTQRLAVVAIEGANDEERTLYATGMEELQRGYAALKSERDSIASQRDAFMRESSELKSEVKKLRKKLDQALAKA